MLDIAYQYDDVLYFHLNYFISVYFPWLPAFDSFIILFAGSTGLSGDFFLTRLHSIYLTTGRSKLMGRGSYSRKSTMLKRRNLSVIHANNLNLKWFILIHRFWMPMFQRFAVLSWADSCSPFPKADGITISHHFIQDVAGNVMIANPTSPSEIAKVKSGKCHWCWPDDLVSLGIIYLVLICWRVKIVARLQDICYWVAPRGHDVRPLAVYINKGFNT